VLNGGWELDDEWFIVEGMSDSACRKGLMEC
jgi:hypothetical protein